MHLESGRELATIQTKVDVGGMGLSCKWTSLSVWCLLERRGRLGLVHTVAVIDIQREGAFRV